MPCGGTRSTKFHLRLCQFESATGASYQPISETHPGEIQGSLTLIGRFHGPVFIQMFGRESRFNGGVEVVKPNLAEVHVVEVWLKLHVTQNMIHFNLLLSGEAKQKPLR